MMTYTRPARKNQALKTFNSPRKNSEITSDRPKLDPYTQQLIQRGKAIMANSQKYLSDKTNFLCKSKSEKLEVIPSSRDLLNSEVVDDFEDELKDTPSRKQSSNSDDCCSWLGLKTSTSTAASSPALLKTLEKIKLMSNKSFSRSSINSTDSSKNKMSINDF